jgi:hypothetical protein
LINGEEEIQNITILKELSIRGVCEVYLPYQSLDKLIMRDRNIHTVHNLYKCHKLECVIIDSDCLDMQWVKELVDLPVLKTVIIYGWYSDVYHDMVEQLRQKGVQVEI